MRDIPEPAGRPSRTGTDAPHAAAPRPAAERKILRPRDIEWRDARQLLDEGRIERVRRGAYVWAQPSQGVGLDRRRRALAHANAVAEILTTDFVFSHETAALLWGCDVVGLSSRTHITQRTKPTGRGDPRLARHRGGIPPTQRTLRAGQPVTSLERTVVDCACALPADRALVIADAGLRLGADRSAIDAMFAERRGGRGTGRARLVLDAADGRSQSAGETLARRALTGVSLPALELQIRVSTHRGVFFLDMGWSDVRVGIEFDGRVKYSGAFGSTAAETLVAEKHRHDALVEAGWSIIRLNWEDVHRPERVVERARRARAGAERATAGRTRGQP